MEKIEKLETGVWAMTLDEAPSLIAIIRRDPMQTSKWRGQVLRVGHPEKVLMQSTNSKKWMVLEAVNNAMLKLQEKM